MDLSLPSSTGRLRHGHLRVILGPSSQLLSFSSGAFSDPGPSPVAALFPAPGPASSGFRLATGLSPRALLEGEGGPVYHAGQLRVILGPSLQRLSFSSGAFSDHGQSPAAALFPDLQGPGSAWRRDCLLWRGKVRAPLSTRPAWGVSARAWLQVGNCWMSGDVSSGGRADDFPSPPTAGLVGGEGHDRWDQLVGRRLSLWGSGPRVVGRFLRSWAVSCGGVVSCGTCKLRVPPGDGTVVSPGP